jgi:hypothetical protein
MMKDIEAGTGTEFGLAGAAHPLLKTSRLFFAEQLRQMYEP